MLRSGNNVSFLHRRIEPFSGRFVESQRSDPIFFSRSVFYFSESATRAQQTSHFLGGGGFVVLHVVTVVTVVTTGGAW